MDRKPKRNSGWFICNKNNKLEILLHNYDNTPFRVPEHINFERITSIKTRDVVSEQKGGEVDTVCYNYLDNAQTPRTPKKFGP